MKRFIVIGLCIALCCGLCACGRNKTQTLEQEDIRAICELATVKCYYNNVAKYEKEADNIFQKDREMWIEYEGEATIGIDMSKVIMKIKGNTVQITLPDAEILSIKPVTETLTEDSYVISSDGWLIKNKITAEEQQEAINKGQEKMEQAVTENQDLFQRAEGEAKELIKNYITQIGKLTGIEYQIDWENG